MGSYTFSAPCAHWLSQHKPASFRPPCIHILICGLDDDPLGTRRFYLFSLVALPGAEAISRSPHLCTLADWRLMVS